MSAVGAGAVLSPLSIYGVVDSNEEIVTEYYGDKPFHTKRVPKKWRAYVEKMRRIHGRLRTEYSNSPNVLDVRIIPSDEEVATKKVNQIGVVTRKGSGKHLEIPESKEGVSVKAIQKTEDEMKAIPQIENNFCYNNDDYSILSGGVAIQTDQDGDGDRDNAWGTACCPVSITNDSNVYMLTANHNFLQNQDVCEGNWNKKAWQHDDVVGGVYKYRQRQDFAVVGPIQMNYAHKVRNSQWSGNIVSHSGYFRVQEMMANGTTVAKMGISTGERLGELFTMSATWSNGCSDLGGEGIGMKSYTDHGTANGDSGGPIYRESESGGGDITILGIAVAHPGGFSLTKHCERTTRRKAVGTAAYEMRDELLLEFGANGNIEH